MTKLRNITTIISLALFAILFGCKKEATPTEPQSYSIVEVQASLDKVANDLRALLEAEPTTPNFSVRFSKEEKIQLWVKQGGQSKILPVHQVSDVGSKGSICSFQIKLPYNFNRSESLSIVALIGDATMVEVEGNIYLQEREGAGALDTTQPPLYFAFTGTLPEGKPLTEKFKHLAFYEVLHITNKSNTALQTEASFTDAEGKRPWVQLGTEQTALNLLTGKEESKKLEHKVVKSSTITIAQGEAGTHLHWVVPSTGFVMPAQLKATISTQGSSSISSDHIELQKELRFEAGHAYHLRATYEGSELFLTNAKGERRNTSPTPPQPQPAPGPQPAPTPDPTPMPVPVPPPAPEPIEPKPTPIKPGNPLEQSCIAVNIKAGGAIYFNIEAAPGREGEVWVDTNSDGKRGTGEEIKKFGMAPSNVQQIGPTGGTILTFYGPITKFAIGPYNATVEVTRVKGTDLKMLDLGSLPRLAKLPLSQLTHLEYLNLSGVHNIFAKQEADFSQFSQLKALSMQYTPTPIGIKLPTNSQLEYLDLTGNQMNRTVQLKGQSKLKRLVLSGALIFGVDELEHTPDIEYIELVNCNLHEPQIKYLIEHLPQRNKPAKSFLYIADNPGVGKTDITSAKAKNWVVDIMDLRHETFTYPNMTIEKW